MTHDKDLVLLKERRLENPMGRIGSLFFAAALLLSSLVMWPGAAPAQSEDNRSQQLPLDRAGSNDYQQVDLVRLWLANDTAPGGKTNNDRITSDPTIDGTVGQPELLGALGARFHDSRPGRNILSLVGRDGEFRLNRSDLERILGHDLEDGLWFLRIEARGADDTVLHAADIAFVLDTTPPTPVLFDPVNLEATNLQLGYIEIALGDFDASNAALIDSRDVNIRNGARVLPVRKTEITSDGLVRYHYDGDLEKGSVEINFPGGGASDPAGNLNAGAKATFDFDPFDPGLNGMPQRSSRMQIEPKINPPYNEDSGASIYLHSGEAFLTSVDLVIPGRGLSFRFKRTYRSGWVNFRTPLGHNWDFNYNRRLLVVTDPKKVRKVFPTVKLFDVIRIDGEGRQDLYSRIPGSGGKFESPAGFFDRLEEKNNIFYERDRHGNVAVYQTVLGGGNALHMTSYTDRNDNRMTFRYDEGRLTEVIDTLGRRIDFVYVDGMLERIRDFSGREVRYTYDNNDDLRAVRSPVVTGTPQGNDYPDGKTEQYSYDTSAHVYRRHNLLTVTAPNEVAVDGPPRETYTYDDHDRVSEQTFGGTNRSGVPAGGSYGYRYLNRGNSVSNPGPSIAFSLGAEDFSGSSVAVPVHFPTTVVTDRNGNMTSYEFNSLGNWQRTREFTNRQVRATDPGAFIEVHNYDRDGQRLTITHDEGNQTRYVFDVDNPDRLQQGNLLTVVRLPDDERGGDQREVRIAYEYEPIYNQQRRITEARGLDPAYRSGIELIGEPLPNPMRFTTAHVFDYQEGRNYAALAQKTGMTASQVETLLAQSNVPMGLGDINGDGRTDQANGNVIRTEHPTVQLHPTANQSRIEGGTAQEVVETFVYNGFGQLVREIDAEGNVTGYDYYSERDPDGDGVLNGLLSGSPVTGGYLKHTTKDAISAPGRNSGRNPPPARIRTSFEYDPVGNVVRSIDGRRIVTEYVVNALNQVVQASYAVGRAPLSPFEDEVLGSGEIAVMAFAPPTGAPVEASGATTSGTLSTTLAGDGFGYIERFWYDYNDNLVVKQVEDRGNTSLVGGNPAGLAHLPIAPVRVGFDSAGDTSATKVTENGFAFSVRQGAGVTGARGAKALFVRDGRLGLRVGPARERLRVSRVDETPFTLLGLDFAHLGDGEGEWVVVSSSGYSERISRPGPVTFSGPPWRDLLFVEIFASDAHSGVVVVDDWRFYPQVDPAGDAYAFADTVYRHDILDNRVELVEEVRNGAFPDFLYTRTRYDRNENSALTILPEGNARMTRYDERDLVFRVSRGGALAFDLEIAEAGQVTAVTVPSTGMVNAGAAWSEGQWSDHFVRITSGTGEGQWRRIAGNSRTVLTVSPAWDTPPDATSAYEIGPSVILLHSDDPVSFDVRGGGLCHCRSIAYDGNGNVVEVVDGADTDVSALNNNLDLGPGDRSRFIYDGFDRLSSTVDSVGNQTVLQYDPAGNVVRKMSFGPSGGSSLMSDGPDELATPVSIDGVVQRSVLVDDSLLSATEFSYDELGRQYQSDQVLFVNTTSTSRTVDVADGAADLGKLNLTPADDQGIPGLPDVDVIGRVSTRTEYDRESRVTYKVEDDGDVWRHDFDGADRLIRQTDPEGNTVEFAYDDNGNLIERREVDVAQGVSGEGALLTGISSGNNDANTLNDDTRSWRQFEWAGRTVVITEGTGEGQVRSILGNTATQLILGDAAWDVLPDATSRYAILAMELLTAGVSSGFNSPVTLNDATELWTDGEWAGHAVAITSGHGADQVRRVRDNNAFQLLLSEAWDVTPSETSRYAVYPHPQPGISEVFITTYTYDLLDRPRSETDNLGQTIYFRHDSRANLVAVADANGPLEGEIQRRAFTSGSLTESSINGFGNVTVYHYDGINRLIRQEQVVTASGRGDGVHIGASVEGVKNDPAAPESFLPVPDPAAAGGDGVIRIGATYDDNSLVSAQIDDQGNATVYLYDNLDRTVAEIKGLTTAGTSMTLSSILGPREIPALEMTSINDPSTLSRQRVAGQLAEARTQITRIASLFPSLAAAADDSLPTTTIYGYSADGNLLFREDENDTEIFTRFDAINRPIAVRVFRAGQNDDHGLDPVFAPAPVVDLSQSGGPARPVIGTTRQNYQYDGLSRLVMASDDNDPLDPMDEVVVTFAYDSLNRTVEETQQIGTRSPAVISTAWRSEDLRKGLTYANGRVLEFDYDRLDRLATIGTGTDAVASYRYVGAQRTLERRYPQNGTRLTFLDDTGSVDTGYDGLRRSVQARELGEGGELLIGMTYGYDRMNHLVSELKLHSPGESEVYSYDSHYRLTGFSRGTLTGSEDAIATDSDRVPRHRNWRLDGAGNWMEVDGETRTHSLFNEVISRTDGSTVTGLTYDDNGNLVDDGEREFEWDFNNRLRSVARSSDGLPVVQYTYDPGGRRLQKNVINSGASDGQTTFVYDGQRVLGEYASDGNIRKQYVYGSYIDEVLQLDRNLDGDDIADGAGDRRLQYHHDDVMSPYALSDSTGTIVEGYIYDAYGQNTLYGPGANGVVEFGGDDVISDGVQGDSGNPYLFTGRRLDPETGLIYYRARYLDPDLGRFLSRDPIGCWANLDSLGNGYAYTGNNPINFVDPTGLDYITVNCRVRCVETVETREMRDPESGEIIGTEEVSRSTKCTQTCRVVAYVVEGGRGGVVPYASEEVPGDCTSVANACADVQETISQKCIQDAADQWELPTASRALTRMAKGCVGGGLGGSVMGRLRFPGTPMPQYVGPSLKPKGPMPTIKTVGGVRKAPVRAGCLWGAGFGGVYSIASDGVEGYKSSKAFGKRANDCYSKARAMVSKCTELFDYCLRNQPGS